MIYLLDTLTSSCGDYAVAATLNLVHIVVNLMLVVAPIVLVISLAIVFTRIMINPEDKKGNKRLLNIILATIFCFFIPVVANILLSILPEEYFSQLNLAACWRNAYNVDYDDDNRAIGIGAHSIKLDIDFTSIKNATPPANNSGSATSGLTPCGGQNLAGVTVQCIQGSGKNIDVVNYALSFEGYPYVWGGSGEDLTTANYNAIRSRFPGAYYNTSSAWTSKYLDKGYIAWDCSGFTQYVYRHFGYNIGRTTGNQINDGQRVASLADAKPGDLLVTSSHVTMYIGNNKIVHAKGTNYGTVVSDVSSMSGSYQIRRIIP